MSSTSAPTSYIADRLHQAPTDPRLALIFPGQGSQAVGMGSDLHQLSAAARQVFQEADAILERPLSKLCFEGPEDELRQTASAQPAIMVTSLACLAATLETGALERKPAFLAGHSLGEYTALVAAGSLTFPDALLLVSERGRLMQEAGRARPGTMAALLGLSEEQADEVCRLSGAEPCNYNSPTQIVIGGAPAAVDRASSLAKERGGRVLPLNVSGAFHTTLMREAAAEFAQAVEGAAIGDSLIPVVGNVTAQPLTAADRVASELKMQMVSPVLWHQSVVAMMQGGIETFVEVGPGRVLTALMKRAAPGVAALSIEGASALPRPSNV
ncbi:MAG: ACP S-malonyltransferase [Chloroflexi bacterium]|nr:ACP S-malonyltransferase [Chloroflexota bacterium]